jgi:hypothetical protein
MMDDENVCGVCGDDPCTCFDGILICSWCNKQITKYNRTHTCKRPIPEERL